jgi:3-deoxy-D-manno-octulosonic-acid transferase
MLNVSEQGLFVVPWIYSRQSKPDESLHALKVLILDLAYLLVFILLSPLWLLAFVFKPAFRAGLRERFIPPGSGDRCCNSVWLHGSSAGEIDLLRPLVARIEGQFPNSSIVISAFAISGFAFAKKAFPQHRVIYFPADLAFIIRRFFRVLDPILIVVVESEFWPNFFAVAERLKIPLCVLNGKMSAKSFRSHKKTGLIPWALRKASLFAVQTGNHAARFRGLGVSAASIHVTGNMKYDLSDDADGSEERRKLRSQYGLADDMPVWIGGSIHRGEDEALAAAQSGLVEDDYQMQLVVVPRYPAEAEAMVEVFATHGLAAVRKTELADSGAAIFSDARSVLIVDTIGDLKRYYAMSDVAYIGGSLHFRGSNKGGHNLMEPAILGIAPIFGPYNFSFQETVRALLDGNAGLQVSDQAEIYHVLRRFLDNPGTAAEMGARARQVILGNRGATDLNFALIEPYISRR